MDFCIRIEHRAPDPHHRAMRFAYGMLCLLVASETSVADEPPKSHEGLPIGNISIERQNVFDLDNKEENNSFYQLINRLHIVTREKIISNQVLFEKGDLYSEQKVQETERILRRNKYLYDASIESKKNSDGSIDVTVKTRDVWTLTPEISYSRSGGENRTLLGVEESNLLGNGQRVQITKSEDVDRSSSAFEFSDRQIGRSWVSFALRVAENSDGHSNLISVAKPFHALDAKWSAGGIAYDDKRSSALYELGHAVAEYQHERTNYNLFGGWSEGLNNGWVRRWTAGVIYDDNRFSAVPEPTLPPALPENRKLVYPFLGFEILEDNFEKTANSNQIERSEDFYFGTRLSGSLGWSDTSFDADRDALIYSFTGNIGFGSMNKKALLVSGNFGGRYESGTTANATATIDARYYSRQSEKRLFFATASTTIGQNLDLDNPIEIGGDTGLRGYPLRYQSGEGRVLFTVEQRYFTDWYPFRLFRVGGAVFFDAGKTFGDDPLGGPNLGWLRDLGFGFRFSPTRFGTKKIIHLDIAFPLDGDPTIDEVQILFEAKSSF
jgi:outer membrane protein assembly factor BamA